MGESIWTLRKHWYDYDRLQTACGVKCSPNGGWEYSTPAGYIIECSGGMHKVNCKKCLRSLAKSKHIKLEDTPHV